MPKQGKLYAAQRGFDPATILLQIVTLQFTYYALLCFLVIFCDFFAWVRPHPTQVFGSVDLQMKYARTTLVA